MPRIELDLDFGDIVTKVVGGVAIALLLYIGQTVHRLDKRSDIVDYRMEQMNKVVQDLYDTKKNRRITIEDGAIDI